MDDRIAHAPAQREAVLSPSGTIIAAHERRLRSNSNKEVWMEPLDSCCGRKFKVLFVFLRASCALTLGATIMRIGKLDMTVCATFSVSLFSGRLRLICHTIVLPIAGDEAGRSDSGTGSVSSGS